MGGASCVSVECGSCHVRYNRSVLAENLHRTPDRDGSSCLLFVSGDVTFYHEAVFDGEACVCDGGTLFAVYGGHAFGDVADCVYLVPVFTGAAYPGLAGSMVLGMHLYDGKSTSELYA